MRLRVLFDALIKVVVQVDVLFEVVRSCEVIFFHESPKWLEAFAVGVLLQVADVC